jgi:hypothetical protein
VRNFEIVSGELALTDGRISRSAREVQRPADLALPHSDAAHRGDLVQRPSRSVLIAG